MPRAMFLLLSRCLHCLGENPVQKNGTTMATGYFYNSSCAAMELCVKLTSSTVSPLQRPFYYQDYPLDVIELTNGERSRQNAKFTNLDPYCNSLVNCIQEVQ